MGLYPTPIRRALILGGAVTGRSVIVKLVLVLGWFSLAIAPLRAQDRPPVPLVEVPNLPGEADVPMRNVRVFQQPPADVLPPPRLDDIDPARPAPPVPFPDVPDEDEEDDDPENAIPLLAPGGRVNIPASTSQTIRFSPRYGTLPNYTVEPLDKEKGLQRLVYTGGVIVNVQYSDVTNAGITQQREIEFATDNVVAWIKNSPKVAPGQAIESKPNDKESDKTEVELFLAGNVVIRSMSTDPLGNKTIEQILRAREIFYDLAKDRAIALNAELELKVPQIPDPVHVGGREIWQLNRNDYQIFDTDISSSKRPAQPGLRITARQSRLVTQNVVRRNIFGIPYRDLLTGEVDYGTERRLTNQRVRARFYNTPVIFIPRTSGQISDPFGPLQGFSLANDRVFGAQVYATFDMFNLLALRPPLGHRWLLRADYLSDRGPALGTDYLYSGRDLFGFGGPHNGSFTAFGIQDTGTDILGGDRRPFPPRSDLRGRVRLQHNQELYENSTTFLRFIGQAAYYSDRDFYEQYYNLQFIQQPNQSTFGYFYGGMGNKSASLLVQGNVSRDWITETQWFPKVEGSWIGESFLRDRFLYSARGSAGYAEFHPSSISPLPILDVNSTPVNTGRFDLNQKLEAPFDLGPIRLSPYGVVDLTQYTEDRTGEQRGRFYGGGGAKASVTLSRLYSETTSELFNLRGLYHKSEFSANYYNAYSDTPYTQLPQLDRLNDEVTDFGYRLVQPQLPLSIKGPNGIALANSPIFNTNRFAIRRLVDNRVDTKDTIEVLQLESRQRFQTKRGFPGGENIVDWLALDLSMSVFPDAARDNFGKSTAFMEYRVLWHLGDRFSASSEGWTDPFDIGAKYINFAGNFNRPNGSNFFTSFRYADPLQSRLVSAGVNYPLSRKYYLSFVASYDFGISEALSNQISVARIGADLTVLFGVSYSSIVNNLGVQFALVPNILGVSPTQLTYGSLFGSRR